MQGILLFLFFYNWQFTAVYFSWQVCDWASGRRTVHVLLRGPACTVFQVMEGSDNDPGYVLHIWPIKVETKHQCPVVESGNRFKDLKCLPRSEREEVWKLIKEESAQQPEPGWRRGPSIWHICGSPLKWWSGHAGAYPSFAHLAQKYLATPATRAEQFGKII